MQAEPAETRALSCAGGRFTRISPRIVTMIVPVPVRWIPVVCFAALAGCGGSPTQPTVTVPELVSPFLNAEMDNGCTDFSDPEIWDFDWTDVPNATAYELYVKNTTASNPVIDAADVTGSSYHYVVNGYVGQFLTGWEWRVRAKVGGVFQDWSASRPFRVEPADTDCR